jgi:death-on-curing protein
MEYLTEHDIKNINGTIQLAYGQVPSVRDAAALDYIVQSARQEVFGRRLYATPERLAAFYFVKLVKKHVFNDANKRTAYLCALLALKVNGLAITASSAQRDALADVAIWLAQTDGETEKMIEQVANKIMALI